MIFSNDVDEQVKDKIVGAASELLHPDESIMEIIRSSVNSASEDDHEDIKLLHKQINDVNFTICK